MVGTAIGHLLGLNLHVVTPRPKNKLVRPLSRCEAGWEEVSAAAIACHSPRFFTLRKAVIHDVSGRLNYRPAAQRRCCHMEPFPQDVHREVPVAPARMVEPAVEAAVDHEVPPSVPQIKFISVEEKSEQPAVGAHGSRRGAGVTSRNGPIKTSPVI